MAPLKFNHHDQQSMRAYCEIRGPKRANKESLKQQNTQSYLPWTHTVEADDYRLDSLEEASATTASIGFSSARRIDGPLLVRSQSADVARGYHGPSNDVEKPNNGDNHQAERPYTAQPNPLFHSNMNTSRELPIASGGRKGTNKQLALGDGHVEPASAGLLHPSFPHASVACDDSQGPQGIFENYPQSGQTLNGYMPMVYPATEHEISMDRCNSCGVSTMHLLRLTERALQWCPADDPHLETLLESGVILPDAGRDGIILRLCLWALRDYALAVVSSTGKSTKDGLGDCAIEPMEKCFQHQPAAEIDDILPTRSDSTSNGRSSLDRTEVSDTNSDGGYKAHMDDRVIRCDQRRRGRWSEIDKNRLRVYMEEGKDLGWIAKKLGRSEDKVNEYGKKLKALQRRRSPRKARSKRTTGL
ncbi:hypothetical protein F4821DRAFT_266202 [Hypoxylon rubiginosum]|uniref:Uncharacterized protein n=1 Tax=Hypoxylon rubiginosum TaxID=110542 RepID=A0ACC0CIE9_9PEZI|nr:hypothetical protein F4821DRAFT_266202 [Hypoxylon rubiginosum]